MNAEANRLHATQLMNLGRWAPAAEKLRLALAEDPSDSSSHALLALCLSRQDQHRAALDEADAAIQHAPDSDHAHWVRAVVLSHDARWAEAERSAREALRIDPENPDHHHILAACLLQRDQAATALEQVEAGLAHDPEHKALNDLRVALLQRLGRGAEVEEAIAAALQRDPDDADHHANVGWSRLRAGDSAQAAQHFSEALRLEPDNEYARLGLVESLKARYVLYRVFLAWAFWMMQLSPAARWAIIIGGYFAHSLVGRLAEVHPASSPFLTPISWTYLVFVYLTWTAAPIFTLLLLLHPLGRHALDGRERRAALAGGICLGIALVGVLSYPATGHAIGLLVALVCAMVCSLLYPALQQAVPRRRRMQTGAALAFAAYGLVGLGLVAAEQPVGGDLLRWGIYLWLALVFLPGILQARGR